VSTLDCALGRTDRAGWHGPGCRSPAVDRGHIFGQLGAAPEAKRYYGELAKAVEFTSSQAWETLDMSAFDGLLLPGGHAPGMRQYLDSAMLRDQVARFWAQGRPVGAICHGVLVRARTRDPATGRSMLADRRTTCLPKYMERLAYWSTGWRLGRYYRTYAAYVEDEVQAALNDRGSQFQGSGTPGSYGNGFNVADSNIRCSRQIACRRTRRLHAKGQGKPGCGRQDELHRPRARRGHRERPVAAVAAGAGYTLSRSSTDPQNSRLRATSAACRYRRKSPDRRTVSSRALLPVHGPGRHPGEHFGHVGVDQALTGRRSDGDPMVAVGHEMQTADAVNLDRRDRLAAPDGQGQPLPSWPYPGRGGPEAPVEVAPRASCANDGIQRNGLQPQLPLAAPAQRGDNVIQPHEPVAVTAPAAHVVRQRGQELTPPSPQKVVLHVCPGEAGIQHRTASVIASGQEPLISL
jgi:putative intracellular protease/amidase